MFAFALALLPALAAAAPTSLQTRTTTVFSADDLAGLAPFTQFARAMYCSPDLTWTCGDSCAANADFKPTIVGGDGNDVQVYTVGFRPEDNSVVVAHEGTDPIKFMSDITDIKFVKVPLNQTLFPGTDDPSIWAHDGFEAEHAKTADDVFAAVQQTIAENGATSVTCVGHSLGGALAELDTLMLTLRLPSDIPVKGVTYGTPRVGSTGFVTFFDKTVNSFIRVNNEHDIVPTVPGQFLGFEHVKSEIHITSPGNAIVCDGDEDTDDKACTDKQVPNILVGDVLNHLGPYEGISLGRQAC